MHRRGGVWARILFVLLAVSGVSRADTFNYTLVAGKHWIALPGSAPAVSNCGQLEAMIPSLVEVWRLDRETNSLVACSCPGSSCFPIQAGEGYQVQVSAPSSFSVTGTDDAALLELLAVSAVAPVSQSGTQLIALPHAVTGEVLPRASDLINSIGLAGVASVGRFITATDSIELYTGRKGSPAADFNLQDGRGLQVTMSSTRYWGSSSGAGCGTGCACVTGNISAGLTAGQMAAQVCADVNASGTYACTAVGDTAVITTSTVGCTGWKLVVSFQLAGGTTTAPHPYGLRLCCNSPLSLSVGFDGFQDEFLEGSRTFGEVTVTTTSSLATVPATGGWGLVALIVSVLMGGVYLLARPVFRG